ncbi:hypothetical protein LR48_Vigan08g015100 [Vigna angularis]|uniref:Uncharacterized protein n=1 Tax=Phaseolus angularis TaxID=3914 RepID=A0A0L9V3K5_PHAAN|nr:hypothetical protein LR48_Vigan08g015100 [Vigna angularis]
MGRRGEYQVLFKVVVDVGVSKEELCYGMVKDIVQKYGVPFNKQNKGVKEKLICVVEEQTQLFSLPRTLFFSKPSIFSLSLEPYLISLSNPRDFTSLSEALFALIVPLSSPIRLVVPLPSPLHCRSPSLEPLLLPPFSFELSSHNKAAMSLSFVDEAITFIVRFGVVVRR